MTISQWSSRRILGVCLVAAVIEGVLLFAVPALEVRRLEQRMPELQRQVAGHRERRRISDSVLAEQAAAQRSATTERGAQPIVYTPPPRYDTAAAAARLAQVKRGAHWFGVLYVWAIPVAVLLLLTTWCWSDRGARSLSRNVP